MLLDWDIEISDLDVSGMDRSLIIIIIIKISKFRYLSQLMFIKLIGKNKDLINYGK